MTTNSNEAVVPHDAWLAGAQGVRTESLRRVRAVYRTAGTHKFHRAIPDGLKPARRDAACEAQLHPEPQRPAAALKVSVHTVNEFRVLRAGAPLWALGR